jgi:cytochrome c peroxidase
VKIFPSEKPATFQVDHAGVAIHGQSFASPAVRKDLASGYPLPLNGFYNIGLYSVSTDPGLERKTHIKSDSGKFKTPTLRNIAVTGPYMHDGSMSSLEEVIAFYNAGGTGARLQDERIRALHLSAEAEEALIAFLETLTDWNFLQNQQFTPLSE